MNRTVSHEERTTVHTIERISATRDIDDWVRGIATMSKQPVFWYQEGRNAVIYTTGDEAAVREAIQRSLSTLTTA